MGKKTYIEAGKIVNTHGIAGEVKIEVWLDSPEFLKKFKRLYISGKEIQVVSARVHKDMLIAKLDGYADINAAMCLKGRQVDILRDDAKLPTGKYFISEIIGAEAKDPEGRHIGTMVDAVESPANMIYIIKDDNGEEHLVPAVPEFILGADLESNTLTVNMLEGM